LQIFLWKGLQNPFHTLWNGLCNPFYSVWNGLCNPFPINFDFFSKTTFLVKVWNALLYSLWNGKFQGPRNRREWGQNFKRKHWRRNETLGGVGGWWRSKWNLLRPNDFYHKGIRVFFGGTEEVLEVQGEAPFLSSVWCISVWTINLIQMPSLPEDYYFLHALIFFFLHWYAWVSDHFTFIEKINKNLNYSNTFVFLDV